MSWLSPAPASGRRPIPCASSTHPWTTAASGRVEQSAATSAGDLRGVAGGVRRSRRSRRGTGRRPARGRRRRRPPRRGAATAPSRVKRSPRWAPWPGRSTATARCPAASSAATWARHMEPDVRTPCASTTGRPSMAVTLRRARAPGRSASGHRGTGTGARAGGTGWGMTKGPVPRGDLGDRAPQERARQALSASGAAAASSAAAVSVGRRGGGRAVGRRGVRLHDVLDHDDVTGHDGRVGRRAPPRRRRARTPPGAAAAGADGTTGGLLGLPHGRLLRASGSSTSSITAIGALSPLRGPIFVMRVYPPWRSATRRRDLREQGVHDALVPDDRQHATARVQVAALGERDEALGQRAQALGLGLGGRDAACARTGWWPGWPGSAARAPGRHRAGDPWWA